MRRHPVQFVLAVVVICLLLYCMTHQRISDSANDHGPPGGVLQTQVQSLLKKSSPNPTISRERTVEFSGARLPTKTDSKILFYNRVAKCGSRSLINLLTTIATKNNFSVAASNDNRNAHPKHEEMVKEMTKIAQLKPYTFYNRHIHYLDFNNKHAGYQTPIYINIIRDPVTRFVSQYNYLKYGDSSRAVGNSSWSDIKDCIKDEKRCQTQFFKFCYIQYFCGFHPSCTDATSTEKIALAKKHIDEDYIVIGMTEEFDNTVMLLEKAIPRFFKGSYAAWKTMESSSRNKTKTRTKDILNEEAYQKLRYDILVDDYKVYEYAKAKYERLKVKYGV